MGLFIFNKSLVSSKSAKDGSANVDLFAVPIESLANITSTSGIVSLYFKDGNSYAALAGGVDSIRGYEYAQVELTVSVGKEQQALTELGRLLTQTYGGQRSSIVVDVPAESIDILGVTGINSIKRFNDLTALTTVNTTINVLSDTNAALGTLDATVPDTVKLMSDALTYAKVGNQGQITGSAAAPSGIAYQDSIPAFNVSFVSGDSWHNFTSGNYNRTNPTYPASYAKLDYDATQALVRGTPATGTSASDAVSPTILESNNAFGNKFRYTDDAGNASSASVSSNLWAHVDWNNHGWSGATQYYVIDHLTGFGFTVKYEDDSGKVNLNTSNNTWAEWITYIDATHHGYTGWMPLDLGELTNAHGSRVQLDMVWADEFFEFDASVSGSTRGAFLTGESLDANNFYNLYDSGNADLVLDLPKATNSGFHSRLTNCFMKRKHY